MNRRAFPTRSRVPRSSDGLRNAVWLGIFVLGSVIAAAAIPRRYGAEAFVIGGAAATLVDAIVGISRGWRRGSDDEVRKEAWPTACLRLVAALGLFAGAAVLLYEIS